MSQNIKLEDTTGASFVVGLGRITENFRYVDCASGVLLQKEKYLE
jgi:hypothetical protein